MKTINLRKLYPPHYSKNVFVEVSDEVAEALLLMQREENNRRRKVYYHKAYYSLDCEDGIETAAIGWEQPSPEDCMIELEEQATQKDMIRQLYEWLDDLTPVQLAREVEVALPVELSREQQLSLVRAYVKDNFVDKGMCADFALHDRDTGNPHAHILLTVRPLKGNGQWGAKCRKVYDLDERGQRIPDGKGGWKNHREDTTDWNSREQAENWRSAWAAYTNQALEAAGRPERIDHRSYQRQGVEKIPSVHLGVAATQMEKRGISTRKGDLNRQIAADNKLLKEIKARITRLYRWSKDEAAKPQNSQPTISKLWEAQQTMGGKPTSRYGTIKKLREQATLFSLLTSNGITTMRQLYEKVDNMNSRYYDLRGKIVSAERRIAVLEERLSMFQQYEKYKAIHRQYAKMKPAKQEQFEQRYHAELALYDAAVRYLENLKAEGEAVTPKKWRSEAEVLAAQKNLQYQELRAMREEIKAVEKLRKTAEQLEKDAQPKEKKRNEPER